MQRHPTDHNGNLVNVTLFESSLALFMVEHPEFYRDIYFKLIDAIKLFIETNRNDIKAERCLAYIFCDINGNFPGCDSYEGLKNNFSLLAADCFIKKAADAFLNYKNDDAITVKYHSTSLSDLAIRKLFTEPKSGMENLSNHLRCFNLFNEKNRGVVVHEDNEHVSSRDFGIVAPQHVPGNMQDYFYKPIESAKFTYTPDLGSYVSDWLTERYLPVIAGTSGSTEMMLSRVLPLVSLTAQEIKMILLAQTSSMIGMGHHSFFECMLVADRFGYKLKETYHFLDFYLQSIPEEVQQHPDFQDYLRSFQGKVLLNNIWGSEESFSEDLFTDSCSTSLSSSLSLKKSM